jgi:hypothetical protein
MPVVPSTQKPLAVYAPSRHIKSTNNSGHATELCALKVPASFRSTSPPADCQSPRRCLKDCRTQGPATRRRPHDHASHARRHKSHPIGVRLKRELGSTGRTPEEAACRCEAWEHTRMRVLFCPTRAELRAFERFRSVLQAGVLWSDCPETYTENSAFRQPSYSYYEIRTESGRR